MDARELRIGNWVSRKDLGDGSQRIESILELGEQVITTGPIKVIYEYRDLNPIPLTEEWLLKFGFTSLPSVQYDGLTFIHLFLIL